MHGEAVAAGMIAEAWIAMTKGMLVQNDFEEIKEVIIATYGKILFSEGEIEAIASLTLQDKKNKGNKILGALPIKIGDAKTDCEISLDEVVQSLQYYLSI